MAIKERLYKGTDKFAKGTEDSGDFSAALAEIFSQQIRNGRLSWYVDYFTEDCEQYRVFHLAKNAQGVEIMMTNENMDDRDPARPNESAWTTEDVIAWFYEDKNDNEKIEHRWIFLFTHECGEVFGIHVEANRVFAFGPSALSLPTSNLWDEYVNRGILGPMRACGDEKEMGLYGMVNDPDLYGHLDQVGLVQGYLLALATVLDS